MCFIQCVGSRDRHIGNEYCSKVCCGVASKEAIEVRQLLPDCKVYIFYIDMRMYGYWESQIYWPAQEKHHVQYVKGIITEVLPQRRTGCWSAARTPRWAARWSCRWTWWCCRSAWSPRSGTRQMAKLLGIAQNKYGFIDGVGSPLDPVITSPGGHLRLRRRARTGRPRGQRVLRRQRGDEGRGVPPLPGRCGQRMSPASAPVSPQRPVPDPALRPGPVVDTESAQEFMAEALTRVPDAELAAIAVDLQRKSAALQRLLVRPPRRPGRAAPGVALGVQHPTAGRVPDRRPSARTRCPTGSPTCSPPGTAWPSASTGSPSCWPRCRRPPRTCPASCCTSPPRTGTGCGPAGCGTRRSRPARCGWSPPRRSTCSARPPGQTYLLVGQAVAFVDQTGKAAGFTDAGPGLFGTDVFLAAVYGVYMNTVLRMRMTQEFNRLVPELPSLIRRLLGVYHLEG